MASSTLVALHSQEPNKREVVRDAEIDKLSACLVPENRRVTRSQATLFKSESRTPAQGVAMDMFVLPSSCGGKHISGENVTCREEFPGCNKIREKVRQTPNADASRLQSPDRPSPLITIAKSVNIPRWSETVTSCQRADGPSWKFRSLLSPCVASTWNCHCVQKFAATAEHTEKRHQ